MKTKLTINIWSMLSSARSSRRKKVMMYLQINSWKLLTLSSENVAFVVNHELCASENTFNQYYEHKVCVLHHLTPHRSHNANWSSVLMGLCPDYVGNKSNTPGIFETSSPSHLSLWLVSPAIQVHVPCL